MSSAFSFLKCHHTLWRQKTALWGLENRIRIMAGQYFDRETGLHYNFRRYYDPATGRYLTPDPIELARMDPNLYGYVLSNPVNLIDPLGLKVSVSLTLSGGGKNGVVSGEGGTIFAIDTSTGDVHGYKFAAGGLGAW